MLTTLGREMETIPVKLSVSAVLLWGRMGNNEGCGCSPHLVRRQSLVPDIIKCSKLLLQAGFFMFWFACLFVFSACNYLYSFICGYKGIMQVKAVFLIRVMSMQTHYFLFSIFIVFMNKETRWFFSLKIEVKILSCGECV